MSDSPSGNSIMKKTIRNSAFTILAQLFIVLMQFINRRFFVQFLGEELLGYQAVLGNVFSWLLIADVGIGNVILYRFYQATSRDDRDEIIRLVTINRYYNYAIAIVIALLSSVLFLFLPYVINDTTIPFSYTIKVYVLYVLSVVGNSLVSHRVIILHAQQKSYLCDQIDIVSRFVVSVAQLLVLVYTKNFLLYLAINLSGTLLSNWLASRRAVKEYPYILEKRKITLAELREMKLFKDCGNYMAHKISWTVYNSTDSIVISAICGIKAVAQYSNYCLLQSQVNQFVFTRLMGVMRVSVGHYMYGDTTEQQKRRVFETLEMLTFLLASFVSICYLVLFQPFILWWLGEEYLLSFGFVLIFVLTTIIQLMFENLNTYRSAYGGFERDRNYMIGAAVINIAVSVALAHVLGIIGIQIGTLVALLPVLYIRSRIVIAEIWHESVWRYWLKKLLLLGLVALEGFIVYNIACLMPNNLLGILLRGLLGAVLTMGISTLVLWKQPAFQDVLVYAKKAMSLLRAKLKRKSIE